MSILSRAQKVLAEARSIDEIKAIRDKAEAARKYAQSAALGLEIQNQAAEVKLRAERKVGSLLAELHLQGGDRKSKSHDATLKLEDLGITRTQSHRWQVEASVSNEEFERYIRTANDSGREISAASLTRLAYRLTVLRRDVPPASPIVGDVHQLINQGTTFACIYADPPWAQRGKRGAKRRTCRARMIEALAQIPIRQLTASNAHLHLWTTDNHLFDAKKLLTAWGFTYRGSLIWVKRSGTFGDHWLQAHEFLLLGVRGKLAFRDSSVMSWIEAKCSRNERKPKEVRSLIERVSPGPYLELFGERPYPGWTVLPVDLSRRYSPSQSVSSIPVSGTTKTCNKCPAFQFNCPS